MLDHIIDPASAEAVRYSGFWSPAGAFQIVNRLRATPSIRNGFPQSCHRGSDRPLERRTQRRPR